MEYLSTYLKKPQTEKLFEGLSTNPKKKYPYNRIELYNKFKLKSISTKYRFTNVTSRNPKSIDSFIYGL